MQNSIVAPTTAPFAEQYAAIEAKVGNIIEAAAELDVNVLCLQEAWTMPFAFCTREKHWNEFAEDAETGRSTQVSQLFFRVHVVCAHFFIMIVPHGIGKEVQHGDCELHPGT